MRVGFPKFLRFKQTMNPEMGQLAPNRVVKRCGNPRAHLSSISVFNIEHPISEFAQFPYLFLVLFAAIFLRNAWEIDGNSPAESVSWSFLGETPATPTKSSTLSIPGSNAHGHQASRRVGSAAGAAEQALDLERQWSHIGRGALVGSWLRTDTPI